MWGSCIAKIVFSVSHLILYWFCEEISTMNGWFNEWQKGHVSAGIGYKRAAVKHCLSEYDKDW